MARVIFLTGSSIDGGQGLRPYLTESVYAHPDEQCLFWFGHIEKRKSDRPQKEIRLPVS